LEEAMLLAQQYGVQLYLDTKVLRVDLLKEALDNTGVSQSTILPSMGYESDILEMQALLPTVNWVWFRGGLFPEEINDLSFYQDSVDRGCIALKFRGLRFTTVMDCF
jgi:hypothetical protein